MNHKTLFGLAAIIAASGFFIRSIQPAHARFGPTVSEGAHPYLSFTGQISNGSTHDLLNVPGGKLFVVTSAMSNDYYCDIYQDSTLLVEGHSRATYSGIFTNGKGNLKNFRRKRAESGRQRRLLQLLHRRLLCPPRLKTKINLEYPVSPSLKVQDRDLTKRSDAGSLLTSPECASPDSQGSSASTDDKNQPRRDPTL